MAVDVSHNQHCCSLSLWYVVKKICFIFVLKKSTSFYRGFILIRDPFLSICPRIGLNVLRWVLNEATIRFSRGGRESMDKFFLGGGKKKKVRLCIYADSSDILAL